jgi:hypothetical protein
VRHEFDPATFRRPTQWKTSSLAPDKQKKKRAPFPIITVNGAPVNKTNSFGAGTGHCYASGNLKAFAQNRFPRRRWSKPKGSPNEVIEESLTVRF